LLKHSGTLIPKVTITGSRVGQGSLDLLEVGHRVGDAVLRYSKKEDKDGFEPFEEALRAFVKGDAGRLAQLAPTSLVFGHWDSRDSATKKSTKSKARRLIRSEIVAYNVQKVTKRSQYWSSIDPEVSQELEQILKEAKAAAQEDPKTKNAASQLGMTDVPVPESPGGVIAFGSIERTTIIALSGIRSLVTFNESSASGQASSESGVEIDAEKTLALRRYLFALALAAAADTGIWDLREGCILVRKSSKALTAHKVKYSGEEEPFTVPTADEAQGYLEAAARAFFDEKESDGKKVPALPPPLVLAFDPVGARAAVSTKGEPKKKGERKKKPSELKRPSEEANRESASETGGDSEREDAAGESASGEGRGEN
jgi:CRISPR-associated protein Csb1